MRRRSGTEQLRLIKGGEQGPREKSGGISRSPVNVLLLVIALFLLAQVLLGWIWGSFNRSAGRVVTAMEGSVDISIITGGILTFEEELIFAPQSGFLRYLVEQGERVPAGKELAVITSLPQEEPDKPEGGQDVGDYMQRFRDWLVDDPGVADPFSVDILFPYNHESEVVSHRAGLVSLQVDGWEVFGPNTSYVYLDDEEFDQKKTGLQSLSYGERVTRFAPILRIMDNYQWYYSTVISPYPGKLIAEENQVQLLFSFAPEQPVQGHKVEVNETEEGDIEITWQINQAAGDFYNHRWCTAEIIYDSMEGVFIPKQTILEQDGIKGVFTVERGRVNFREVTLLEEEDDLVLVEGLNPYERIIARPGRVKEGQRFMW